MPLLPLHSHLGTLDPALAPGVAASLAYVLRLPLEGSTGTYNAHSSASGMVSMDTCHPVGHPQG